MNLEYDEDRARAAATLWHEPDAGIARDWLTMRAAELKEPHPWYGPCDGGCSECKNVSSGRVVRSPVFWMWVAQKCNEQGVEPPYELCSEVAKLRAQEIHDDDDGETD